jgi:hypothetical protein
MSPMIRRLVTTTFAITMLVASGGCSEGEHSVQAEGQVIEQSSAALSIGSMQWANGTYGAGCVARSGGWSLRISGSATMDDPALSVVKNNTACALTLTSIEADQSYTGTPAIILGTSLAGSASSFAPTSGGALAFYANAVLSSASFASDFVVTILYSDDPNLKTGSVTSGYAVVAATSTATDINSPDYTINLASFVVQVDVNYIVQSASGTANLIDGSIAGTSYFVDQGTLGASPTFEELDTAYNAASPAPTSITGADPQVAAAAFGLVGVDLSSPAHGTIVIRRLVSGVPSYETFRIAFSHP